MNNDHIAEAERLSEEYLGDYTHLLGGLLELHEVGEARYPLAFAHWLTALSDLRPMD